MKNCFGNSPASIYGDDAKVDEPNESPTSGRGAVFHAGKRGPAKSAPQEIDAPPAAMPGTACRASSPTWCAARPIDITLIDGIESVSGGEGPWIKGLRLVQPGVLIAGTNPVTTDAVATAVMGYDPQAQKGPSRSSPAITRCCWPKATGSGPRT